MLVGVPIAPSNDPNDVELFYQDKTKDCIFPLKSTNLFPQHVFFGHEMHWIPSLTFVSLVLNVLHSSSILTPLHTDLLPKLKIMHTFLLVIHSAPT